MANKSDIALPDSTVLDGWRRSNGLVLKRQHSRGTKRSLSSGDDGESSGSFVHRKSSGHKSMRHSLSDRRTRLCGNRRSSVSIVCEFQRDSAFNDDAAWSDISLPTYHITCTVDTSDNNADSDSESVLSIQSKVTAIVKDSTDDMWFLESDSDTLSLTTRSEDIYLEEYEVASSESEAEGKNNRGAVSESESESIDGEVIVFYSESELDFFADEEKSSSDDDISDNDIARDVEDDITFCEDFTQADLWSCSVCRHKNRPISRYCDMCWMLRPDWLRFKSTGQSTASATVTSDSVATDTLISSDSTSMASATLISSNSAAMASTLTFSDSILMNHAIAFLDTTLTAPTTLISSDLASTASATLTFYDSAASTILAKSDTTSTVSATLTSSDSTVTSLPTLLTEGLDRVLTNESVLSNNMMQSSEDSSMSGSLVSQSESSRLASVDDITFSVKCGESESSTAVAFNANLLYKELGLYDNVKSVNISTLNDLTNQSKLNHHNSANDIELVKILSQTESETSVDNIISSTMCNSKAFISDSDLLSEELLAFQQSSIVQRVAVDEDDDNKASSTSHEGVYAAEKFASVGDNNLIDNETSTKICELRNNSRTKISEVPINCSNKIKIDEVFNSSNSKIEEASGRASYSKVSEILNSLGSPVNAERSNLYDPTSCTPQPTEQPNLAPYTKLEHAEQSSSSVLTPCTSSDPGEQSGLTPCTSSGLTDRQRSALDACVSCLCRPKEASIVHGSTGHQVCCYKCARRLKQKGKRCPICRRPIDHVIRNYIL